MLAKLIKNDIKLSIWKYAAVPAMFAVLSVANFTVHRLFGYNTYVLNALLTVAVFAFLFSDIAVSTYTRFCGRRSYFYYTIPAPTYILLLARIVCILLYTCVVLIFSVAFWSVYNEVIKGAFNIALFTPNPDINPDQRLWLNALMTFNCMVLVIVTILLSVSRMAKPFRKQAASGLNYLKSAFYGFVAFIIFAVADTLVLFVYEKILNLYTNAGYATIYTVSVLLYAAACILIAIRNIGKKRSIL